MSWFHAWRRNPGAQQFAVVILWCALIEILAFQVLTEDWRIGASFALGAWLIALIGSFLLVYIKENP